LHEILWIEKVVEKTGKYKSGKDMNCSYSGSLQGINLHLYLTAHTRSELKRLFAE